MNTLVLATATFIGIHFLIAGTPVRAAVVGAIGEKVFQAVFFLAALLALVWMFTAYGQAPRKVLWEVPAGAAWLDWLFLLLNLIASIFVAAGLTVKNPGTLWMDKALHGEDVVTGFLRITRHPMNMGIALWALTHILQTGEAASLILFGGIFTLAALGPLGIDAKRRQAYGEQWEKFAAQTSYLPFGAILTGRNKLVLGELGWWRLLLGVVLFAALVYVHGQMTGIDVPLPW